MSATWHVTPRGTIQQGPGGRSPAGPSSQATLADEISGFEECNDCFLALLRDDRDFDLALLNKEDAIRGVALGEDDLAPPVVGHGDAAVCPGQKRPRVKFCFCLPCHDRFPLRPCAYIIAPPALVGKPVGAPYGLHGFVLRRKGYQGTPGRETNPRAS